MSKKKPTPAALGADIEALYTPAQVAEMFGLSTWTIRGWRRLGRGPRYVRTSKKIFYTASAIREYLAENEKQTIVSHAAPDDIQKNTNNEAT